MNKAIIFDLFGTLTNGKCNPEKAIIQEFNLGCNYKFVESFVCGTKFKDTGSYMKSIIKGLNMENSQSVTQKLIKIFNNEFKQEQINPAVSLLLKELKSRNYKLAVISNIPNPSFDILSINNLKKDFNVAVYSI